MSVDYVAKIRRKDRAGLRVMLASIIAGNRLSGWSPGMAFEYLVVRAFELDGAEVTYPFLNRAGGEVTEQIDGAVYAQGLSCLIESKDHSRRNNIEPIAKLRNQLLRRPPGTLGIVFSRSGFTEPAKTLARNTSPINILLWEVGELEQALRDGTMCAALRTKYRAAVEYAIPDYDIKAGLR